MFIHICVEGSVADSEYLDADTDLTFPLRDPDPYF